MDQQNEKEIGGRKISQKNQKKNKTTQKLKNSFFHFTKL